MYMQEVTIVRWVLPATMAETVPPISLSMFKFKKKIQKENLQYTLGLSYQFGEK